MHAGIDGEHGAVVEVRLVDRLLILRCAGAKIKAANDERAAAIARRGR